MEKKQRNRRKLRAKKKQRTSTVYLVKHVSLSQGAMDAILAKAGPRLTAALAASGWLSIAYEHFLSRCSAPKYAFLALFRRGCA